MSTVTPQNQIEYPESDGKPMGETDLHRDWMVRILEIFRQRYADQRVYIASDLLVYYEEGTPTKFVVPDNFVVLDCDPGRRRIFKTWEEGRVPDVVFEVTSRRTSSVDIVDKPVIYEQMGVKEYFLYDPTAEYLSPALQGYRWTDGYLKEIPLTNGRLGCDTLGIELCQRGKELVILDAETGIEQLTEAEIAKNRVRQLEAELKRLKGE